MDEHSGQITVYSDHVCPFCYLGRRSLAAYQETRARPLAIDWHPFDLRRQQRGPDGEIDHSVDDGRDEAYLDEVRRNVARLQDEYDADEMLGLDEIPADVDSFDAQVASLYVMDTAPERWLAFDEAVLEALWVDGRDIGEGEVLAAIAEACGLDGEAVRAAVADEQRRDRLRAQFAEAHQDGVTGVPTFVYEGYGARGAVPPAQLERLVEGT